MTKALMLAFVSVMLLAGTAFISKKKSMNADTVMVYGIVYVEKCNSEAYRYYAYEYANGDNYNDKQTKLKESLERDYPNAKRIRVGSSKKDFGNSAKGMCIIKWQKTGQNNCKYEFAAAYFGESGSDAYSKAMNEKNKWAGKDAYYTMLEEISW